MKTKKINPLHLDQQLCFALYSASRLVIQAYDPLLKNLNLTYPQYLVMLVLWEGDNVSVKDISEKLKLDSGTLSPLLKKLQVKGLINKTRLDIDERIVAIELTTEGRFLQKLASKVPLEMACILDIKEKEIIDLRKKLNEIVDKIEK